jgi:hypothetical protein
MNATPLKIEIIIPHIGIIIMNSSLMSDIEQLAVTAFPDHMDRNVFMFQ